MLTGELFVPLDGLLIGAVQSLIAAMKLRHARDQRRNLPTYMSCHTLIATMKLSHALTRATHSHLSDTLSPTVG